MICQLIVVRYPKWLGWAGFLSMALFRFPLWFNRQISFWKLMGCGRNGTFDKIPDWRQWAVLLVWSEESGVPIPHSQLPTPNSKLLTPPTPLQTPNSKLQTLHSWWKLFGCEKWELLLEPIEGHGTWDGKHCFGELPGQTAYEGRIGILTRATIRIGKLGSFWNNADSVAPQIAGTDGLITSLGIGEVPWIKQATFSIWESRGQMKQFAYQLQQHAEVIRKTRRENWYSEEMFVRFRILSSTGSLRGNDPLQGKL